MFQSRNLSLNMPENALFLLKNRKNLRALGALPPDLLAFGGWELCLNTSSLRRLGVSSPYLRWSPVAGGSALRPLD